MIVFCERPLSAFKMRDASPLLLHKCTKQRLDARMCVPSIFTLSVSLIPTQKYLRRPECTWFSCANLRQLAPLSWGCVYISEEPRILNFPCANTAIFKQCGSATARHYNTHTLTEPTPLGWKKFFMGMVRSELKQTDKNDINPLNFIVPIYTVCAY